MAGIFGWHFRAPKATAFASLRCLVQILIFVDAFSQCYNASKATASRFDPVALSLLVSWLLSIVRAGWLASAGWLAMLRWYRCSYGLRPTASAAVDCTRFGWLRLVLLLIRATAYGWLASLLIRPTGGCRAVAGWLRLVSWLLLSLLVSYTIATASATLSIHTRKPAEARYGFGWLRLAGWLCFAGMLRYTLL